MDGHGDNGKVVALLFSIGLRMVNGNNKMASMAVGLDHWWGGTIFLMLHKWHIYKKYYPIP